MGAGPAGLHAAISAKEHGASVLVFDKKTKIGVPVRCGEYFPRMEEMVNLLPGAKDYAHLFEMPAVAISNECDRLRIFSSRGKSWEFTFLAHVLDRTKLEQHLADKARRLGVEFMLGRTVRLVEENHSTRIVGKGMRPVEADVVIAADGFPSTIAFSDGQIDERYRGGENVAINYQYLMGNLNIESNVTEMYMGTSFAPGGYGWIIPKGVSAANVGIGLRTGFVKSGKPKDCLDHFVCRHDPSARKLANGSIQTMIADVLPVDGAVSRTYSNRTLLVGDSAAMVMPTNGGGIPTAMVSGHLAGEVAALHVQRGEPLSSYEVRWRKALGFPLVASTRMRRFADIFMSHDRSFDLAMRVLQTDGIKNVVTCKIPRGVGLLMKLFGY